MALRGAETERTLSLLAEAVAGSAAMASASSANGSALLMSCSPLGARRAGSWSGLAGTGGAGSAAFAVLTMRRTQSPGCVSSARQLLIPERA